MTGNLKKNTLLEDCLNEGLWSLFIPRLKGNFVYKYEITQKNGKKGFKNRFHMGFYCEKRPNTASYFTKKSNFKWKDKKVVAA